MRTLTFERLRELMHYDPETGDFTYRVRTARRVKIGAVAGNPNVDGYFWVSVKGERYRAHRLAWLYMTGEWPPRDIDHKNLNRSDNRWANLRLATDSQNKANIGKRADNTSGYKGVFKKGRKWEASIGVRGKRRYLGSFSCIVAAHLAYVVAADKHFGDFARHN